MRSTRALSFGAFALSASFMMVFPLLPELQQRTGVPTSQLGWVASTGFIAALFAQLVIAPLADRGRERLVIGGSVIVMSLACISYVLASGLQGLVIGRIGAGLAYGAFMPAATGLIVRHFPGRAGELIGKQRAMDLGGMAVGPLLSVAGKTTIGADKTLMAAAVLTLLIGLPSLTARWSDDVGPSTGHSSIRDQAHLLRHRSVIAASLLVAAYMIPLGAYDALYARFLTDLGAPDWLLGVSLTIFAVPAVVMARWAGRMTDKHDPFTVAAWGGIANIAVVISYGVIRVAWIVSAMGLLESGGQMMVSAAGAAAMGWAVPGRRAATAQGLGEAVGTIAAAAVAIISAPLYASGGPAALFFTAAALTATALAGGVLLGRRSQPAEVRASPLRHEPDAAARLAG